ncbi:MAG: glycosyltransferase family 4 protein [Cyclobacteriaceae bacterium]
MKVAIVSCGLLDTMLPLVRALGKHAQIDLYVSVYGQQHKGAISSFDLKTTSYGLIDEKTTEQLLGKGLSNYAKDNADRVKLRLFRYPDLKMLNQENYRLNLKFAKHLNAEAYDVIHLNGYRGSLMVLYQMLDKKPAKIWTIHDPVQHSGEVKWQTKLGYSMFRWLNTHYILHNKTQQPDFIRNYKINPDRCHYVNFGPLDVFRLFKNGKVIKPEVGTVLFYGRISPYKGVEYLIEAAHIAREQIPGLKVIIAGKPIYPIDLEAVRNDPTFEIIDRYIENGELVQLLQRCQLVACPYTDATQSGVVMTAYAFHKPVLASAVGGIPEVIEDGVTGRLIPPKDAKVLAATLVDMLGNQQALADMQAQIKEKVNTGHLAWEKIAIETAKVYEAAMR